MPQIADSGYLTAYWNKADQHHSWARSIRPDGPLRTCEAVLTEAAWLMRTSVPLLRMLSDGDMIVSFEVSAHVPDLLAWLKKYADLRPDFADACVVKLGDLHPTMEILTTDRRDFSIYRTLRGKPLRCIFPP